MNCDSDGIPKGTNLALTGMIDDGVPRVQRLECIEGREFGCPIDLMRKYTGRI